MEQDFSDWIGRSVTRKDIADAAPAGRVSRHHVALPVRAGASGCCPPGLHFGLAPATPETDETGPDGAERKGLFLPPIPLPRRMWAGGSIETFAAPAPVGAGDPHLDHRRHPHEARQHRRTLPRLDRA